MAQKINPMSFRLGTTRVWDTYLQNYGKSYSLYSKILHKKLQTIKYLNRLFYLNQLLLDCIDYSITKEKVDINVQCVTKLKISNFSYLNLITEASRFFNQLISIPINIRLYENINGFITPTLIGNYIRLSLDRGSTFAKINRNLVKIINDQLGTTKVYYCKTGIKLVSLKGFKLRLAGRSENSRNQMSREFVQNLGSLSLTNLESYIEYTNQEIFTRQGVCGLQIWLFYKVFEDENN